MTKTLQIQTTGRGLMDITDRVAEAVRSSGTMNGLCNVFIHHTSASLIICENADPDVQTDLLGYFERLVQDGDPHFTHTAEGPDDMSGHVRSVLTATSLNIPVTGRRMMLGTWQGIFLFEHRTRPHTRKVSVTVIGG